MTSSSRSDDSMQVSLDSDISDTECTGRGPRILSTTPTLSTTKGGGVAKSVGLGFRPGAVAQFDGAAAGSYDLSIGVRAVL